MADLATAEDVSARVGRELSTAETGQAEAVIAAVTGLIAGALSMTEERLADLEPIPTALKVLAVEKAAGLILNPAGAQSETKQLGQFTHTVTFAAEHGSVSIFLTDHEERRVRRAVYGANTRSVSLASPYSGRHDGFVGPELPL